MSEWAGVEGLMNIRKSMIQSTLLDVVAMFRRGEKKYRLAIKSPGFSHR